MAHVSLDAAGNVVAVFGSMQDNSVEIADDDPRLVAFLNPPGPRRVMLPLDFFKLFTDAEKLAIATAAVQNAQVLLWFQMASAASIINLDDPDLIQGMAGLLSNNLITQDRHDRIMSGLPPA
jgi:hypothetical protein